MEPRKNDIITITRNKITGDRSFTHSVFKVVSVNKTHIEITSLDPKDYWFGRKHILSFDEHDFSYAGHFISMNDRINKLFIVFKKHVKKIKFALEKIKADHRKPA